MTKDMEDFFEELEKEEERKKEAEQREKALNNDLISTMSTKQGRKSIAWILSLTGFESSVTSLDPMAMAMASARRDVGLAIKQKIKGLCPNSYSLMIEENSNV